MIEKYILSNGIRLIMEKIETVRSVSLGIWVATGSRNEEIFNNGISHFIEHMMFKGTRTRSAKDIAEAFDNIGGQVNAFTSKEYTCYYARVVDQHTDIALEVLADMYFNSVFSETEIEREKNVVIEEIKMSEDTPDDLVHDLLTSTSFGSHPLGYSILGTEKVLKSLNRSDILKYIKNRYTTENTVITVVGNYDSSIINKVENYFKYAVTATKTETIIPPLSFQANQIIKEKQTEQVHLTLGIPGLSIADKRIYSLIILNNILGGSMSSRLFQEIREQRGLAYSIFSYHTAYQDGGLLAVYAGTSLEQTELVIDEIFKIFENIKKIGITKEELIKGKEQLKGSLMLSLESTNSRMNRLGKNEILLGRQYSLDELINQINDVTLDNVQEIIEVIFNNPVSFAMVSTLNKVPSSYEAFRLLN